MAIRNVLLSQLAKLVPDALINNLELLILREIEEAAEGVVERMASAIYTGIEAKLDSVSRSNETSQETIARHAAEDKAFAATQAAAGHVKP